MSHRKRLLVLGLAGLLSASMAVGQMMAFFEVWAMGNRVTNQDSKNTTVHSGLVGWRGAAAADVQDDALANFAAPAVDNGVRFVWAFGQCFGGGMFDELFALGGTQSGTSASRHGETARYPMAPPRGVGHDWVTRYVGAMNGGALARATAATAAAQDPFGTNPGAPRGLEVLGTEHPQYFSTGAAADNLALYQANGIAILWSGQPNLYDRNQIVAALDALVAMGYARDRIYVFYGAGRLMGNHPIVQRHMLVNPSITLRAATANALGGLFAARFGLNPPCEPDFVFFLANDHGFNTNVGPAPRAGDLGDPHTYEDPDAASEDGEHGDGDSDQYEFPLGAATCPCDDSTCPPDAGDPTPDAGSSTPDAGEPTPDAGSSTPDAGSSTPDAGASSGRDAGIVTRMH